MQEFTHTARTDFIESEKYTSCPYFDNCYLQSRNDGLCFNLCSDNPNFEENINNI